jgi:hypothetical protein
MGKHVHAEVIKAWAEGAEVQVFRHEYDGYYWEDTATPSFNIDFEYRVKPAEKVVRWLWLSKQYDGMWHTGTTYMTEPQAHDYFGVYRQKYKKLDWSREEFDE